MKPALTVLWLLCCTSVAHAVQVESVTAKREGDRYLVAMDMTAELPEAFAREILEDPDRVVMVNEELVSVTYLPSDSPGVRRFRDHTRACAWLFCVDYENTLRMRILENSDIQLVVEPELSEFNYGVFTWQTKALGPARTRIRFQSESEPGFWVPSIDMLRNRMRKGIRRMILRMECAYRHDTECTASASEDSTAL